MGKFELREIKKMRDISDFDRRVEWNNFDPAVRYELSNGANSISFHPLHGIGYRPTRDDPKPFFRATVGRESYDIRIDESIFEKARNYGDQESLSRLFDAIRDAIEREKREIARQEEPPEIPEWYKEVEKMSPAERAARSRRLNAAARRLDELYGEYYYDMGKDGK